MQAILKTHFPKLYKVLTGRDPSEKFKARDGDTKKKILQETNRKLSSVSREHIIGHMAFSDWKSYSSDEGRMPSLPPHKRRKSIAVDDKVTSRFLPSEKFEGRSAQVWSLIFFAYKHFGVVRVCFNMLEV